MEEARPDTRARVTIVDRPSLFQLAKGPLKTDRAGHLAMLGPGG